MIARYWLGNSARILVSSALNARVRCLQNAVGKVVRVLAAERKQENTR